MLDIKITKATTLKEKPVDETTLGFGKIFTDHIVSYGLHCRRGLD